MKKLTKLFLLCGSMWCLPPVANTQPPVKKLSVIGTDNFSQPLDTMLWKVETISHPENSVYTSNNKLWLDTKDGVTVWFRKKLTGNYCIEYDRGFPADSTLPNYRLSDLNNFWQASDPRNPNLFSREGILHSYDSIRLYYAGIGGNYNSTTRFRRYNGIGEKALILEYRDANHLLQNSKTYHVAIVVRNGATQLWVNQEMWFSFTDPSPLPAGYFGLRSTKSLQWVSNLTIWEIE